MAALILAIVGIVLVLFILAIGIYITFYPLSKTIKGGMEVLSRHAEEKKQQKTVAVSKEVRKGRSREATGRRQRRK